MFVNTPPLGWNTWNTFGAKINEELILQAADAMIETGLKDAGYNYVVIDDIWALKERDADGKLVPDPEKFPHGMKYIADYLHERGLKFGMYSCAGYLTCAGYPASYEHEWDDAKSFAEWEVDFLKYDYCFHPVSVRADILYKRMGLALANCGRDILFSACSWGSDHTRRWIKETGASMWRSTGDIMDSWASIRDIAQSQLKVMEFNGHGCFNDMDMLVVGMNGQGNVGLTGCTYEEYRLHFSLWAFMNSPLMIGCDTRQMDEQTRSILTNRDILAINQDPDGRSPFFVNSHVFAPAENRGPDDAFYKDYPLDTPILAKFLSNGDIAIGLFNLSDTEVSMWQGTITFDMLGLPATSGKTMELRDLWSGEVFRAVNGVIQINKCAPHDCRVFRAKIVDAD